jgi:hypothetical protein
MADEVGIELIAETLADADAATRTGLDEEMLTTGGLGSPKRGNVVAETKTLLVAEAEIEGI